MKLHMCVFLCTKFQFFGITSFRHGGGEANFTPVLSNSKRTPKKPNQIRVKLVSLYLYVLIPMSHVIQAKPVQWNLITTVKLVAVASWETKAPEKKYSQVDLEKLTLDYAHRRFHKHLIFQNITLSNWLQIKDH